MFDIYLTIYLAAGIFILLITYIVLSLFTDGVRAVYSKYHQSERKRRVEEWERKRSKN